MEFRKVTLTPQAAAEAGKPMVEVWKDGKFVAGIYVHDDGIRIVSKFLDGVEQETNYPPSVILKLSI